ncbi:MAG TPA: DUF3443 family protein [Caldimonas sp.]|nr:DUF3443 family protein [Caldimonas sp.]
MRCANRRIVAPAAAALAVLLTSCGGGNSSVTTITGSENGGGNGATVVSVDAPIGPNTTEIVVDAGPASGFSLGAANIPYVAVTVCTPGSATDCVTIDHVFLDTGSVGLRLLKSTVATLVLAPITLPADTASGTPAGRALECYPFVLGAVWGPLASADLRIAGEAASSLPVQIIDDAVPMSDAPPANCIAAANGGLQNSMSSLQAKGILGIGMVSYDCGLACSKGDYASGYTLYYSCPGASGAPCSPAAIPSALQVQNPVAHFAVNNNGTIITLPALPDLGAGLAKGRLVFGIGTQSNNQIPLGATMYFVDPNPANPGYLYFTTTSGGATYVDSYVDSGSNALFFDDASVPKACQSSTASSGGWYCPPVVLRRTATVTDAFGATGSVDYSVANADALFSTSGVAFAGLAGSAGQGANAYVWGLPFFYGRSVFTSIWGQALSPNGPWNAF